MEETKVTERRGPAKWRAIVITGVAGSGKTTVGRAAAARLEWRFCDADDLHAPEAIARIEAGDPLDDEIRRPWLLRVRKVIEDALVNDAGIVVACSALKEAYRRTLADGLGSVRFAFLAADVPLIRARLENRRDHFAGPRILESQFEALEPPSIALVLDARRPVQELVETIVSEVRDR